MCIICNCPKNGDDFLCLWYSVIFDLKKAEKLLLACYKESGLKQYDKAHKALVKRRKDLAKIEQIRETEVSL